jgi:hypothetical protein
MFDSSSNNIIANKQQTRRKFKASQHPPTYACSRLDDGRAVGIYTMEAEPSLCIKRIRHHLFELID